MTSRNQIRFGDSTIEYEVRRSRRRKKTIQITVDGGGVQVAAPCATPDSELRAIVRKRAPWILSHATGALLEAAPKRFVSGETLPYLGRNIRLVVKPGDARALEVRFDHWRFHISISGGLENGERNERVRRSIVEWYRGQAADRVQSAVERWWPRLGHEACPRVLIRDQRQRWGSCAPDGTLRFNWRAAMLEPLLLEYVVVHELVHLRVKNHSSEFWGQLSNAMPDAQRRRRRLREVGRALPLRIRTHRPVPTLSS